MAYIKESFMKRKMITCIACVIFCNFITFTPVNANPTTNALLCNNKTIQLIGRAPIGMHIQQCSTSKAKNITQFFQNPQKNYNTAGKCKIGKVKIKSFSSRCTEFEDQKKIYPLLKNSGIDKRESVGPEIVDERYLYAETYLPVYTEYLNQCGYKNPNIYANGYIKNWKGFKYNGYIQQTYILQNVYDKPYSEKRQQFGGGGFNSFSRIIETNWSKIKGATGYEVRLNQNYNGNWTGWTYRRTSASNVKIMGLQGGLHGTVKDYYLSGLDNRRLTKVKYKDDQVYTSLSIGCTYKLQVRAYKKVGSKYYYGDWSDVETAKKIKRTAYARADVSNGSVKITVPDVYVQTISKLQHQLVENLKPNPFASAHVGFEVQVSDTKDFKNAETRKVESTSKEITLNDIPKGKYVRVRTYSNKKDVLSSEWSSYKKVK